MESGSGAVSAIAAGREDDSARAPDALAAGTEAALAAALAPAEALALAAIGIAATGLAAEPCADAAAGAALCSVAISAMGRIGNGPLAAGRGGGDELTKAAIVPQVPPIATANQVAARNAIS